MNKGIEIILVLVLLAFSFFAGVKYSNAVKTHAGWLFEPREEEVELPDLSGENGSEVGSEVEAPADAEVPAQDSTPMDSIETKPAAAPNATR